MTDFSICYKHISEDIIRLKIVSLPNGLLFEKTKENFISVTALKNKLYFSLRRSKICDEPSYVMRLMVDKVVAHLIEYSLGEVLDCDQFPEF
jgi:hypothetical protein